MSRMRWTGDAQRAIVRQATEAALKDGAEYLLEEANRTIPHDTGTMMRTGATTTLSWDEQAIHYDTPYALRQHEDTRLRHLPGRRARWLALTLEEQTDRIVDFLTDRLRRVH